MRYQLDKQTIMGELRRDRLFFDYSEQQLSADLEQLIRWKNLTAIQDPRKVRTVADFQNKQYQYMMSQAALEIERMTMTPENLYAHTQQTQLDSGIQQLKSMEDTAAKKEWKLRESKQTVQDCDRAFQADLRLLDDTNRTLMLGHLPQISERRTGPSRCPAQPENPAGNRTGFHPHSQAGPRAL